MTSFTIKIRAGTDDRHLLSMQLRQDFGANCAAVKQTALADIFELINFKTRKENTYTT